MVKISQDADTRIIVENRDGQLVARIQRKWLGQWEDFAEVDGAPPILITPSEK